MTSPIALPTPVRRSASFLVTLVMVAAGLIAAPMAVAQSQNEVLLGLSYDGTRTFDTDPLDDGNAYPGTSPHTPGLDARADNGVVRTYDLFGVRIDWNVNEDSATNVVLTAQLPPQNVEWVVPRATNPPPNEGVPSGCLIEGVEPASTFTSDGRLICNLGDQAEGQNGTIFADARLLGALDGDLFNVDVTMTTDTDPSGTVVSELPAEIEASAAPVGDWSKSDPEIIQDVNQGGVDGDIFV